SLRRLQLRREPAPVPEPRHAARAREARGPRRARARASPRVVLPVSPAPRPAPAGAGGPRRARRIPRGVAWWRGRGGTPRPLVRPVDRAGVWATLRERDPS